MKFRVTFKTPDAVETAIMDELSPRIAESEDEKLDREDKIEELKEFASQWVKYDEYITVEFDTEAGTCRVVQ